MESVPTVLFACVHNAGRSQMAAALFERRAAGRARALSAGSDPADAVHSGVVEAMAEVGVDLSAAQLRRLENELVREADVVVTMGCGDACPVYPGKRYEDWDVDDPAGKPVTDVRPIRDDIARRVDELVHQILSR
jgi:protein-tyrosine-phosphatase